MMQAVKHIDVVAYGFRNPGLMVSYKNGEFEVTLPVGYMSLYWKINEGLIVLAGASLN
jgi:hypothetical protein